MSGMVHRGDLFIREGDTADYRPCALRRNYHRRSAPMTTTICPTCDGQGELETGRRESETGYPVTIPCARCDGNGSFSMIALYNECCTLAGRRAHVTVEYRCVHCRRAGDDHDLKTWQESTGGELGPMCDRWEPELVPVCEGTGDIDGDTSLYEVTRHTADYYERLGGTFHNRIAASIREELETTCPQCDELWYGSGVCDDCRAENARDDMADTAYDLSVEDGYELS